MRHARIFCSAFVFLAAVRAISTCPAADVPTSAADQSAASPPASEVYVGIYVNQIDGVSLKDSKLDIDFHIWFRWKDEKLKPIETFDLVNGQITSKQDIVELPDVNGFKYACCRVLASLHQVWDVERYPLDEHLIQIAVEDGDFEEFKVRYLPDTANSGLNDEVSVAGWVVSIEPVRVESHRYGTNYGDVTLPTGSGSSYSRFVCPVRIGRPGYGLFIKLFTGMLIAAAIALHALLIAPSDLDARFALTVGAMFAAVASEYVVVSSLPDANYLTLADRLHILTFVTIFLSMGISVVSYKAWGRNALWLCRWLDRTSFVVLGAAYATLVLMMIC
jgi:hypothetical protein